jgi:glycosyltransferase involved in cell wall biosynthesis
LAVAWAGGLRELGHEVVVVTTDQHFDGPDVAGDDVVLDHRWWTPSGLLETRRLRSAVRRLAPDVVVADELRDPRVLAAVRGRSPMVLITHDAAPHDRTHRPPLLRRLVSGAQERRSNDRVVFSAYVASVLRDGGPGRRPSDVHVLPLTSEMPDELVPPVVPAAQRHDFLLVGRMSPYKNVPAVLDAWARHRRGAGYRGDRLLVIGDGDPGAPIPDGVERLAGRYTFADLAPRLAAAKGALAFYRAGSQSGVALTAMQCGTCPIVSDVGGLAEYLPDGVGPIPPSDVGALAARFDQLADPETSAEAGRAARRHYQARYDVRTTSRHWARVLERVQGLGDHVDVRDGDDEAAPRLT